MYKKNTLDIINREPGKLYWNNLKMNFCPNCDKDFVGATRIENTPQDKILIHKCGFKIRERVFSRIVNSMITKELEESLNKEYENYTQ
jgi:hypothetical protein